MDLWPACANRAPMRPALVVAREPFIATLVPRGFRAGEASRLSVATEPRARSSRWWLVTAAIAVPALSGRRQSGCTLGALTARRAVAAQTAAATAPSRSTVASDAGLLLLEHLNLNVLSTEVAMRFYEALGCRRDARRTMTKTLHNNCGALTQFHTPSPDNEAFIAGSGAQRWRGDIELLYASHADADAAAARARALLEDASFAGTKLAVNDGVEGSEFLIIGPYGNRFLLRVAEPHRQSALRPDSGARPGSENCSCVGLGGVTLQVPPRTAERGARFYADVLGFAVREVDAGRWAILGGPGGESQRFVLEEVSDASGEELGEHVAIYIGDFVGCFERLLERGLIFVNPRFEHLDKSRTVEEALHYNCFRFKDIVDPASGEKLFELEHEVRCTDHKSCPPALAETR